jgi:retinol-binding protein 3
MKYLLAFILLLFTLFAQANNIVNLSENIKVISTTADLIEVQFVSKTLGERVATELRTMDFQKQYANIHSRETFAKLLTKDLRKLSGDNHIGIVYSPDDVQRYRARQAAKSNPSAKNTNDEYIAKALAESRLANFGIQQVRVLAGNVGYLEMRYFDGFVDESAPVFASVMDLLASSKAIILDLRRNGGGNSKILPLFLGYFLGPESVHFATRIERWKHSSEELYTLDDLKGARHFDKPLYILTSGTTFSLAEHVTYHLKAFNRAIVIGERTYGGGKAFDPIVVNDDFYLRIPRIEMLNAVTNTMYLEGQGITPDVLSTAETALEKAYLIALTKLQANEKNEDAINNYQWAKRIATAKAQPQDIVLTLPTLVERQRFEEFEFEIRAKVLWMSFRHLPWVELINLGGGYYFDDRSIQRQFSFKDANGTLTLLVSQEGGSTVAIKESTDTE